VLARKQKTYAILDADDDEDNDVGGNVDHRSSVADAPETRKVDTHKKRFRKKIESQDDEDDEVLCLYLTDRLLLFLFSFFWKIR
jgi:pre-mRNA-splicing factor ATP-dependent RNA helicase DHX16